MEKLLGIDVGRVFLRLSGVAVLPDRKDFSPDDYLGSVVEVVHMRNRAVARHQIGEREQMIRKRIRTLEQWGVSVKNVGFLLEPPGDRAPRIVVGALADECVVKRARYLARQGVKVTIDNVLTIRKYGE